MLKTEIKNGKPIVEEQRTHSPYIYISGYILQCLDLGEKIGVKLELSSQEDYQDESMAMHLPPAIVKELANWLSYTLGQEMRMLPNGLIPLLTRMRYAVNAPYEFKQGDKRVICEALKALHHYDRDVKDDTEIQET